MSEPTIRDYVQHKPTCPKSTTEKWAGIVHREQHLDDDSMETCHDPICRAYCVSAHPPCTCGLDRLLAALAAPPDEPTPSICQTHGTFNSKGRCLWCGIAAQGAAPPDRQPEPTAYAKGRADALRDLASATRKVLTPESVALLIEALSTEAAPVPQSDEHAANLRQGCECRCSDHGEGSDCGCECHASLPPPPAQAREKEK